MLGSGVSGGFQLDGGLLNRRICVYCAQPQLLLPQITIRQHFLPFKQCYKMPPAVPGGRNTLPRQTFGKYSTPPTRLPRIQPHQTTPSTPPAATPRAAPPATPSLVAPHRIPFYKQYNFWTTTLAILALLAAFTFFLIQWLYQDWTAHKDFREYCQSEQVSNLSIPRGYPS